MAPPRTAKHGSPTRWRDGCHCTRCYRAHLADVREWRHSRSFDAETAGRIIDMLSAGRRPREVAKAAGVSWQAVIGRALWDPAWRRALDDALMAGRDPDIDHGSETGYRHGGCRCPECRAVHEH